MSDANYSLALRLLDALSQTKGDSVRERENARKAALLTKKLRRNATRTKTDNER